MFKGMRLLNQGSFRVYLDDVHKLQVLLTFVDSDCKLRHGLIKTERQWWGNGI